MGKTIGDIEKRKNVLDAELRQVRQSFGASTLSVREAEKRTDAINAELQDLIALL